MSDPTVSQVILGRILKADVSELESQPRRGAGLIVHIVIYSIAVSD